MAAAYAALVSLSHILHQILHPPPAHHYIIPRELIESLREQVSSLITFLEKYSSRRSKVLEDLEKRIVDAAHEAEDIIESDVVTQIQEKYARKKSSTDEIKDSLPIQKVLEKKDMHQGLPKVTEEFISIEKELAEIKSCKGMRSETSTGASSSRSLPSGNDIMVGFDEHLNQIRIALASHELDLQVVPVVGMGGIGKTTLATNVYKDPYLIEHFQILAWVSVSQEYMVREIVLALLQQINSSTDPKEVEGMSADELGTLIHKQLFGRRYLLVLDDMWDIKAWDILKRFFPNNSNGSRILVTTRLFNLAEDFNSCRPYQIGLLNEKNSWDLILDKVFGKEACPIELEKIGRGIARKCGGLPLGLVVIGGLLAKSEKTKEFWEYVDENVTSAANNENDEHCTKILRLSYEELPVHLKPCFLYLVVFPKTFEIRTSRLIRLWVAEGIIKAASDKSIEEIAESYFKDLVDRNLIMVSKRGYTGKVKNCIIHDLIRDLCMREAHQNKFLFIAKLNDPNTSPQLRSERRLSIHTGTKEEKVRKVLRSATLTRSFLSYCAWQSRQCISDRLNLLRILDAVDSYPLDVLFVRLINSRYISCAIPRDHFHVSSSISLLWNLQTLVFPAPISLPSEIWQMPQLRHLKMPGITLPDPSDVNVESESIIVLEHLLTLSTVKDFIFRKQMLRRIPNVKKLGIDCDTIKEIGSFCLSNLVSLDKLESLVLAFRGTWKNMDFPVSLKKLTLSHCEIPWEDMYMVGSLPNLEVLKLQTHAAKGRVWNPNVGEFCRLKVLLINRCELEIWGADDSHFPCLEHLHLIGIRMEEIPMDFAEIATLETIDLNYCSRSLFASAKRMSEERENLAHEDVQIRSPHLREAAVESFLENLKLLMLDNHSVWTKNHVKKMIKFYHLLKAGQVETDRGDIRRITDEAQDIIDDAQRIVRHKGVRGRCVVIGRRIRIGKKLRTIVKKMDDMIQHDKSWITDFADLEVDVGDFEEYAAPEVREPIMVGFEDEVKKLKGYLLEESQELDVIPIIGMPGLGKTTIAGKVFRYPEIQFEFPICIWVYVSREFTAKGIFLAILKEFTRLTEDIKRKTSKELADLVVGYLENRRFLLVMDDVWSCEDWDKLHIALPKSNKLGKVLITSRQAEVGWHVNRQRGPHMLRFLTLEESFSLLGLEVFRKPEFPPELELVGKLIAERCDGLPLAIVLISGTLVKWFSGDMSVIKTNWENLSKSFYMYLDDEDIEKRMEKIISLSFEKLPDHLRDCFLYFGLFPQDFEIPAWKLIRIWIAEGLIQQKVGISLEETAENYLRGLINRNLVRAETFTFNGKVKTCRIHDVLRDFCQNEAGIEKEGLFQEIKMSSEGGFQPLVSKELKCRGLCIHSNVSNFLSEKPFGKRVYSFVCFSRDEITVPTTNTSAIFKHFRKLRVVDAEPIRFNEFNEFHLRLYALIHLRYLVLSVEYLEVLPSSFSRLWEIQTLMVNTDSRTLEIQADILSMIQLRHFKTNASATLPKSSKSSRKKGAGGMIQTLGIISPESCNEVDFDRARNLKKLGVRGKLAMLLNDKNGSFDSLGKLGNLEKLKLINDVFPTPRSGLPRAHKFPAELRSLTLSETSLKWHHMSILGSLEKLEVLKLKDRAFWGECWEANDGGFRRLEFLHIGRTNLKNWVSSQHGFPRLKHLQLNKCEDLQQVPIGLADIPSFQKLDLFSSGRAALSAVKIHEAKKMPGGQHSAGNIRRFQLSIFPHEK